MDNISITDFCSNNEIDKKLFFEYLRKKKYIYSQPYGKMKKRIKNIAYPQYDTENGNGLFEMNRRKNQFNNKDNINIQLTPKGQTYFTELHDKGEF